MFLRSDIAEHRRAVPTDHRSADGRGDVVITGVITVANGLRK
jgi:hypothetical protein